MATEVGSIFVKLGLDTSALQEGVDNATSKVQQMGQDIAQTGKDLTLGLSAPIAAAGGAAVKAAGDFEQSFSRIEGLVGVSEDSVQNFKSEVLALSGEVAQSPRELANAMFQITSAGLEGEQALNALESSAKAAAAGLGNTKTVADAATSAMNAYGQENLSAAEATDVLTAAVREGKVQPEQLSASLGKVIPTAAAAGVEFEQVGAAIAAMTRQGANAQRATTALNSLLAQTQDPSSQAEKALKKMGMSAEGLRATIQEDGLLPALQGLKSAAGGNTQEMAALFGNVRAMRAAMQLAGESADKTREIFDELANSTGSTDTAFQEAKQTFNFQFRQFRTAVQRLRIELGNELLPAVTNLVQSGRQLTDTFSSMSGEARKTTKAFAALAVAIPPALYVGGKLMVGLSALASTAIPAVGTALAALATPFGAVLAGITAIAGSAALIVTNFAGLRDSLGNIFSAIGGLAQNTGTVILKFFQFAIQRIIRAFEGLVSFVSSSVGGLASAIGLSELGQSLQDLEADFGVFGQSLEETKEQGQQAMEAVSSSASDVGTAVSDAASTTADNITSMMADARDEFLRTFGLLESGGATGGGESGASFSDFLPENIGVFDLFGGQGGGQSQEGQSSGNVLPENLQVWDLFKKKAREAQSAGQIAMNSVKQGVRGLNNQLANAATSAKSIGGAFKRMGKTIINALTGVIAKLTVAAALSAVLSGVGGGAALSLGSSFSGIFGSIVGLDSGGLIQSDGIAKVHKGEAVVNREMMKNMGRGGTVQSAGSATLAQGEISIPVEVVDQATGQGSQNRSRVGR